MSENDEILTMMGYAPSDVRARLNGVRRRRRWWQRKEQPYQSRHEAAREAERARQAAVMRGTTLPPKS